MRFGLILGDQLHHQLATLKALDRTRDVILMAEVVEEATYVAHHPQKIALIFSAMRHFAKELKAEGWRVRYHAFQYGSPIRSLLDFVQAQQLLFPVTELVMTRCGEYRLQQQIEKHWSQPMTEIQLTNIQFAQLQLDNLVAKDKPYIESWLAGDVGSFNAILNAVDYDNEFTFNMRGWSRQRVKSGTGAMIEVNEMNADQLYHLFTCYLSGLPSGVVESLKEVS